MYLDDSVGNLGLKSLAHGVIMDAAARNALVKSGIGSARPLTATLTLGFLLIWLPDRSCNEEAVSGRSR